MRRFLYIVAVVSLMGGVGCSKNQNTPRPFGYHRIDLPVHQYKQYDSICPFSFDYPVYGQLAPAENKEEPCFFNIEFSGYQGTLHLSYKPVKNNLDQLTEDARTFAYKHSLKADAIKERLFADSIHHVYGLMYEIEGNAASSTQFFVTDSSEHFLRGALYFNTAPNKDSLAPVIAHFRRDIEKLIETFEWK